MRDGRGRGRLREALDGVRDVERLAGRAAAGPRHAPRAGRAARLVPPAARRVRGAERAGRVDPAGAVAARPPSPTRPTSSTCSPTWPPSSPAASKTARPPPSATAASSATATTPSSTSCARSATGGGSTSPRSSSGSASAPASPRSRSASTRCSATTSRSPTPTPPRCRADYERRQTLASAERYVTPELKDYEARVLGAEERMAAREAELFGALRAAVGQAIGRIQRTARVLARLDVWAALAERAVSGRYVAARGARRVRPRPAGEPPPGDRADDAARDVHPQRRALHRGRAGGARHRTQHGGQIHHPPPDRPVRGAGADGRVRAGRGGLDRRGGPALHPGRRERQPRPRPVHLHGGDERDQRHPAQRRPRGASSCSTRSGGAPRPTTASRSPGR